MYVIVSSAALLVVPAIAYKILLIRIGTGWQEVLNPIGGAGAVALITLVAVRGIRLLRRLEVDIRSRADDS